MSGCRSFSIKVMSVENLLLWFGSFSVWVFTVVSSCLNILSRRRNIQVLFIGNVRVSHYLYMQCMTVFDVFFSCYLVDKRQKTSVLNLRKKKRLTAKYTWVYWRLQSFWLIEHWYETCCSMQKNKKNLRMRWRHLANGQSNSNSHWKLFHKFRHKIMTKLSISKVIILIV